MDAGLTRGFVGRWKDEWNMGVKGKFFDIVRNYFRYGVFAYGSLDEIEGRDEIWEGITGADEHYEIEKVLNDKFGQNYFHQNISNALFLLHKNYQKCHFVYEKMYRLIYSKKYEAAIRKMKWVECDVLSYLFQRLLAFEVALLFREIAIEKVKHQSAVMGRGIILKASAYFEEGRFESARTLLRSFNGRILSFVQPRYYKAVLDVVEAHCGSRKTKDAYGELIDGKVVVLLGPADFDVPYVPSKDDVIVRFTYRGKAFLDERECDIETDVSYYNHFNAEKFFSRDSKFIDDIDSLKFIVMKGADGDVGGAGYHVSSRIAGYVLFGITFGGANMAAVFLYDLMQYAPKEIRISHLNLWTSKRKHTKGYMISDITRSEEIKSIATHDPIGNFNYVKSMYRQGIITADDELRKVLELTPVKYCRALNESFS